MHKFIICFFATAVLFAKSTGLITGSVIDGVTHQPLPGASILIAGTSMGTSADGSGRFRLENVPVGSYTIRVEMIGYRSVSRANVHVVAVRPTPLRFSLEPVILEGQGVTVSSGFFETSHDAIISSRTVDIEEIRSDPAGGYDVQRMMQALPSVVSGSDQMNEIIVRGGGPGENLFVMDHLEIPNPNHFGIQSSGGGPINMLNTEFIDKIDFYAGGFPAKYGDKISSVMDIYLREGNHEKFEAKIDMNMAGLGAIVEGPVLNGKGSYLASIRQSYLKYVIKNTGLAAIPEYWNGQLKVVWDINDRNKLMFNYIKGEDYIQIEDEEGPMNRGADNVISRGFQYTSGLTLKSLFSKNGYSLLSLGFTKSNWSYDVYSLDSGLKDTYYWQDDTESDTFLKGDLVYRFNQNVVFSTGFNFKYGQYDHNSLTDADTIFVYLYGDPVLDDMSSLRLEEYYQWLNSNPGSEPVICSVCPPVIIPEYARYQKGHLWKYAAYSQVSYHFAPRWTAKVGFRYDRVPYNSTNRLNPRIGLSYQVSSVTKVNFALGRFTQTPSYSVLLYPKNPEKLKNPHSDQIILGIDHLFAEDTKASVEVYYKTIKDKPIERSLITGSYDSEGFVSERHGRSYGAELFIQKKFAEKWYGTFSYSLTKAEGLDPRYEEDHWYDWNYDYGSVLTVIGGYKYKFIKHPWYMKIREKAWFSFINWLPFAPADELEISFRYRYAGGRPYTPKLYDYHTRTWVTIPDPGYENVGMVEWNTDRLGNYSRFDIMILRRFNFPKVSITTFFDLQNVFNRDNPWDYTYYSDGRKEMAMQYKQMPVGGVIIEF